MPLNYTFKAIIFTVYNQGGKMNGRVKIDRLVYLNNIYAIDGQISLSGALNNLLIYHWYCQQEPTVTVSIWHYFTFHSALVRLQPESHSRHHNSRKMRTDWKLSKPGLQRWSQVGEHTPQGKTEGVINFLCGERLLRGDVITIFQYLKNIYNEDRDSFTRTHVKKTGSGYKLYWKSWHKK